MVGIFFALQLIIDFAIYDFIWPKIMTGLLITVEAI